jgi:hypothetical protein
MRCSRLRACCAGDRCEGRDRIEPHIRGVESGERYRFSPHDANLRCFKSLKRLERVKGIEPSYSAWKSENLETLSKAILTFCCFLIP